MTKNKLLNEEQTRNLVYNFYLANKSQGKAFTVNHFKRHPIPRSTIYSIIQRAENSYGVKRKVGSGRIAKKMVKKERNALKKMFDHKNGCSY